MGKDKIKAHGILLVVFFFFVFCFFPFKDFFSRFSLGGWWGRKELAFSTKTASGKYTFANDDSPMARHANKTQRMIQVGSARKGEMGTFERARQPRLKENLLAIENME